MAFSIRYLLDRLHHPRSRADELARLRARYAAQPHRWRAGERAVSLAVELRQLRGTMLEALGEVDACARCAEGHPWPAGRWAGGHCCGGRTLKIFAPEEVAALKLARTGGRRWRPPRSDHAGCVFRGPQGCSLAAADRPTICVRFVCVELRQELIERGRWPAVARLNTRMAKLSSQLTATLESAAMEEPWRSSASPLRAPVTPLRAEGTEIVVPRRD